MKKTVLILIFVALNFFVIKAAQAQKFSNYYYRRVTLFAMEPVHQSNIIFLGGTNTNTCEWHELFHNKYILNRGIMADDIQGVYDRLKEILKGKPKKIFLLIGITDLKKGASPDSVARGISTIADKIKQDSPKTLLYIQSLLPVSSSVKGKVTETNKILQKICQEKNLVYIDLYDSFTQPGTDKLNSKYTNNGQQLLGPGYLLWKKIITPYVN